MIAPARGAVALVLVLLLALAPARAQSAAPDGPTSGSLGAAVPAAGERFDRVWRLVSERYWDLPATGVDWDGLRERYRARALAAEDETAFHGVLEEMLQLLGDDHSRYVPPERAATIRESYGDLPCIGVFSLAQVAGASGPVAWRIEGRLGVIRLSDLARDGAAAGVRGAVLELTRAGAEALVLDLRGNPGGRLVAMMTTAGVFTEGLLWRVVTSWSLPLPYPALGATASDLPLAVLIDRHVHSAAEGLAGALQSSGRALLIGERTAGNVEAVLPFCLRDGSQVWLATGVLAPLTGPSWEGEGVVPDLPVAGNRALEAARKALLGR